ncbi:MAG: reverse transcriptase domain-containing protein [Cetobacterium sp.]
MIALKITANNNIYHTPIVKDIKSVLISSSIYSGLEENDIDSVSLICNGEELEYNYKNYATVKKLFFIGPIKEKLEWFKPVLTSLGRLEMFHNDYYDTRYEAYKHLIGTELRIDRKKTANYFDTLKMIKKNGVKKERYVCCPKTGKAKVVYSDLKDLLNSIATLEPEMLGCGLGVQNAIKYFDNFETIVKIDFKDFFNQISHKKFILGLQAELPSGFSEETIKSLAYACCPFSKEKKKRATWQGLPTSTMAAYIAIKPLFIKIKELLSKYDIVPTIYIDDLCFGVPGDYKMATKLKKEVMNLIISEKFCLNFDKCKVLYGNKTFFLGINMQTKKLGANSYVRGLKAGLNNHFHSKLNSRQKSLETLVLKGKLNYLKMVNEESYKELLNHEKYGKFINHLN